MACIKPNTNKICTGNLNRKIKVQYTSSTPSNAPGVNAGTAFKDLKVLWAMIKTRSTVGSATQFVQNINANQAITTEFYIRWTSTIDFEKEIWVEFNNKRFKVDSVENIDEADEFVRLACSKRGKKTVEANQR